MNIKQIASIAVAAIGVFLVGYGFSSRSHISSAEIEVHKMSQSKNPIVKSVGKDMETKVGRYESKARWSIFGGIILVVLGGGATYMCRKHKKQ